MTQTVTRTQTKKILVVMPCLNYFKGAVETLQSIKTKHDWEPYIIPNWRKNKGVSASWNEGLDFALTNNYDYALVVNDDILMSPGVIDALVETFEDVADKDTVMVTAHDIRSQLTDPYTILDYHRPGEFSTSEGPDFSCFMVRPNIIEEIGRFDENIYPAYFEDNDYHYRIKLAGKKAICTTAAPYCHLGSKTQNFNPGQPVVPPQQFENIRQYYVRKWGGTPGNEVHTEPFGGQDE